MRPVILQLLICRNTAFALCVAQNSRKLHQKCTKCSKQLLITLAQEDHRFLSGFLNSNIGYFWLKTVYINPPHVTKTKMLTNFTESLILQRLRSLCFSRGITQQILRKNLTNITDLKDVLPRLLTDKQKLQQFQPLKP